VVLLVASIIFYALMEFRALYYIVFTICSIFFCGKYIQSRHTVQANLFAGKDKEWLSQNRKQYTEQFDRQRKLALAIGLFSNFGILFALKYLNFVMELLNSLVSGFWQVSFPGINWLLPIGLSFYTFMATGYLIDVYRKKYPAEQNIAKLALFVSFFPQLVQGPIGRYDHLAPQLFKPHKFEYQQFTDGLKLMGWGFVKKLLIADILAPFVNVIIHDQAAQGSTVAVGIIMSMIRLYADFSGGIDVSRGVAQCMGIEMAENFRRPYFATSMSNYWRRWHITLGAWMKDYLLYSITFSRGFFKLQKFLRTRLGNYAGKIIPTCLCMFFTFFVVGIWHGGNTKYLFFGFYNGTLIALGILAQPLTDRLCAKITGFTPENKLRHVLAICRTLVLVFIGRCIATADDFSHGYSLLKTIVSDLFSPSTQLLLRNNLKSYGIGLQTIVLLIPPLMIFLFISLLQENGVRIRHSFAKKPIVLRWAVYYFAIFYILLFGSLTQVGGFIYAQF